MRRLRLVFAVSVSLFCLVITAEGTRTYAYIDAGTNELRQQKTGPLRLDVGNRPLILASYLTADRRCDSGSSLRQRKRLRGEAAAAGTRVWTSLHVAEQRVVSKLGSGRERDQREINSPSGGRECGPPTSCSVPKLVHLEE